MLSRYSHLKNLIKKIFINKLSQYFEPKITEVYYGRNPFKIEVGNNSFFEKPKIVHGGQFIKLGHDSSIGHSSWLGAYDLYINQSFNPQILLGNNVRIGNYVCITCIDEISICDGCLLSDYVYISDHYHGFDPMTKLSPAKQPLFSKGKIKIGENTFIGYRVTILSGVSLGKNCVVGAHSVVTKSFPDYSMIAGAPAKIIKKYSLEENNWIEVISS